MTCFFGRYGSLHSLQSLSVDGQHRTSARTAARDAFGAVQADVIPVRDVMTAPVWEFEHSAECAAPRAIAWEFWTDVSNWERIEGAAVESIRLHGEFAAGTAGTTKARGQEPRQWTISELDPERSATIEMVLGDAVFSNSMTFDSVSSDRIRITQRMALHGDVPQELIEGIRAFEATAPQGLARLASAIELATSG